MTRVPTFQPSAAQFLIDNAYFMATASQAAYEVLGVDPASDAAGVVDSLSKTAAPWPALVNSIDTFFEPPPANAPTPISGFVASTADAVILAFRGTANLPGWLTDGNIVQVPDPDTATSDRVTAPMVHRGFKTGLDSVWDKIVPLVQRQFAPGKKLWITGHSLGAALATLAANRFTARMPGVLPVTGVYSFGSPRVGNDDFFAGYKPVYFRVVNNDDIVPHVPLAGVVVPAEPAVSPWSLAGAVADLRNLLQIHHFTYIHVGSLKYMNRNGQLGEGTSDQEQKELQMLDTLEQLCQPPERSITDHYMNNYISALCSNI